MDDWDVRQQVFTTFAEEGRAPSVAELAVQQGVDEHSIRDSLIRLHEAHAIVLTEYGDAIRMAHPFSATPMGFVVTADAPYEQRMWWGGCAWDSFGISAALKIDVTVDTRCPGCTTPLRLDVGPHQQPEPDLIAHIPKPAAQWWDDVVDTCNKIRLFCSTEHLKLWASQTDTPVGQAIPATTLWQLAQPWYGDRLNSGYRPRPLAESQALLTECGLTGDFWTLPE
ncbi:alkylmercury lyase family protein [Sinosporangium siamense]|uniref:Membrane protein n=1 Tax=Sinosporangium siamense TaxID=1367973 RepID=A0A919RA10_9ACTN|nr:alkylmercury lyase family protein [Sinosporangium siamense]GII89903.1 membrane protein [Sinosporangium siamense]